MAASIFSRLRTKPLSCSNDWSIGHRIGLSAGNRSCQTPCGTPRTCSECTPRKAQHGKTQATAFQIASRCHAPARPIRGRTSHVLPTTPSIFSPFPYFTLSLKVRFQIRFSHFLPSIFGQANPYWPMRFSFSIICRCYGMSIASRKLSAVCMRSCFSKSSSTIPLNSNFPSLSI